MLFSEKERAIYTCPFTNRDYDPLAVRRELILATKNAFGRLCDEARSTDPLVQAAAEKALIDAARKAFGLEPLKVLDATVWETLVAFTKYLSGKEPRASRSPGASPSSAGPGSPIMPPGSP